LAGSAALGVKHLRRSSRPDLELNGVFKSGDDSTFPQFSVKWHIKLHIKSNPD